MISYAQMMRDFKEGNLALEMVKFYDKNEIPEKNKGIREITKIQTKAIYLLRQDNKESCLELPNAKLVTYDRKYLRVYGTGKREMTSQEKAVMQEWKTITKTEQYQKDLEYDVLTDYSGTYYQKKKFFTNKNMLHLFGTAFVKGMKRDYNTNMIFDNKIKGQLQLEYKVHSII